MLRLLSLALVVAVAAPAQAQADTEPVAEPDSVVAAADLALTISTDADSSYVGDIVTYTLSVRNESDDVNAVGIQVAGPFRRVVDGATFLDADAFQGTFDSETGLWTVGRVDAGRAAQMVLRVRMARPGAFLGCAEIAAAAQPDPDSTPYSGAAPEDDYACAGVVVR